MTKLANALTLLLMVLILQGCSSKIIHVGQPVADKIGEGDPSFTFDVSSAFKDAIQKKDYRFMGVKYPHKSVPGLPQTQEKALLSSRKFRYIEEQNTYIAGTPKQGNFSDQMAFSLAAETYNYKMIAFLKKRK